MNDPVLQRNNVHVVGQGPQTLVLVHGFGCDQSMWAALVAAFRHEYRLVLLDHVGCGGSDYAAFDPERHGTLEGYARDLVEVAAALDLQDTVLVGHSVSAMIGALAAQQAPQRFTRLVMVAPSPRYLNDPATGYVGGFEHQDVVGLLDLMDTNYTAWAHFLAQAVSGNPQRPELADGLAQSFCAMHPDAARSFAEATFFTDSRADLARIAQPTLLLQCSRDAIAPEAVGAYMHRHIAGSTLQQLQATGHCPHVSHPEETVAAIRAWLQQQAQAGG